VARAGVGVGVQAIACYTRTGRTANLIAADRPDLSIYAFSSEPATVRQLAMVWGVTPFLSESPSDIDAMIGMMDRKLIEPLGRGATVVLVAAAPVGQAHTNLMKVHHLGSRAYGPSS
jgi:pyruvate kinase